MSGWFHERIVKILSNKLGVAEYRYEFKISQLLEARLRVSFVSSEKSLFIP